MELWMGMAVALTVTAICMHLLRRPATILGLVDRPSRRKRHTGAIPLIGGVAIAIGFGFACLLQEGMWSMLWPLLAGMGAMLLIGLYDDLRDLPAIRKFLLQIVVVTTLVLASDIEIRVVGDLFGLGRIGLDALSLPFTVFCIVFLINAVNMADGLDGLAGGMIAIMSLLLALLGWLDGAPPALVVCCLLLFSAMLGFLPFNLRSPVRRSATAFLGDSGSMMLGFAVAWLAIMLATAESARVYPVSLAWVVLVPAADTCSLFLRRLQRGRSPFAPDRTHLHHLLSRLGLSVPATVALLHGLVLATGLLGIAGWRLGWPEFVLFCLLVLALVAAYLVPLMVPSFLRRQARRMR